MSKYLVDVLVIPARSQVVVDAESREQASERTAELLQAGQVPFRQTTPNERVAFIPHELTEAEWEEVKTQVEEVKPKSNLILPAGADKDIIIPGGN